MNEPFLEKLSASADYIDLRPLIDDKTVLRNPHKGWYLHYIDNGITRPTYRDGIADGDWLADFPGLNHLYLRVDWDDIEHTEGCYDWTYLDKIFADWGSRGYKFSFRFCCFETSNSFATPEWVKDAGAAGAFVGKTEKRLWEPDYGDPVFLAKLESFIARCAEKYDGNPLVEFVDVGTFGTWGEGHTYCGSMKPYSADALRRHIDLHLRYFRKTTVILNDDFCYTAKNGGASRFGADGVTSALRLADYCAAKGMGARDDSACVRSFVKEYGYDTLRNAPFFDKFYQTAPVDIELQHYHEVEPDEMKDCFPYLAALQRAHATYAGFHGYPRPWLEKYPYFTEYMANRLGYWYFLTGLELNECVSGMKTLAKLHVENRGFAPAYNSFTLKVRAGEHTVYEKDGLNLGWTDRSVETLGLDFTGVPAGGYRLYVGLFEGEAPVRLAIKESRLHDSWYDIGEIAVTEG